MFDSHCHLDFEQFDPDRARVWARARAAGIDDALVPGVSLAQNQRQDAVRGLAGIHLAVGIHPYFGLEGIPLDEAMTQLEARAQEVGAVAIGECGLDKKKRGLDFSGQVELFEAQLNLAGELELPLVIHLVGARDEFLASLARLGTPRSGGVVHGFSGDASWAHQLVSRGFHLGIGPALLRPERRRLHQAVLGIPRDRLLLETDAPDQAPPGVQRGEPEQIGAVLGRLASLLEEPSDVLGLATAENARRLLGIDEARDSLF